MLRQGLSRSDFEEAGGRGRSGLHIATTNLVNLSLPDHCHRLVAGQHLSRYPQAVEAEPRSDQPFDPAVVLLNDVVQVFGYRQLGGRPACPGELVPGSRSG